METKILVIEDNVLTLDEIESRLSDMGYKQIETAVCGEEAIEKAESFKPDLILSDIHLGDGIDGIETVSKINENNNVPIIYLTAFDDDDSLKRAKISDPYAYLMKPLEERELNIAISIALYKAETEKKLQALNSQLQYTLAEKDKFFSILAHDLRNPFNIIMNFSNMLVKKLDSQEIIDEKIKTIAGAIQKSSNNTFKLLQNLLEWAQVESDRYELDKTTINLAEIIKDSIDLVEDSAGLKNIAIDYSCGPDLQVLCDENMLKTVLRNLISNAVKFTKPGGEISISCKQEEDSDYITILITDTGIGIPEKYVDKLFQIGSSISTPGTNNEEGTGLGLILCKQFIEKNGGTIWIDSEVGKGSTFGFTLSKV